MTAITGKLLAFQFSFSERAAGINLDGVTHEQSLIHPAAGGNCINWIVGHIVTYRHEILASLGEVTSWPEECARAYGRGSSGGATPGATLPLSRLVGDLKATTPLLVRRLEALKDEELAAPAPSGKQSLGERLAFDLFHEAYHVGQLGVLRRTIGLPGAIR